MRIMVFDEETGGLSGRDPLLVHSYKFIGKPKITSVSVLDFFKPCSEGRIHFTEEPLVRAVYESFSGVDAVVTFNGKNFDMGILRTKFMKYRMPPLAEPAHIDLYQVARPALRLPSKSLKNIAKYLGLRNQKMELPIEVWEQAKEGDIPSLRLLKKRAASDVLQTEELYLEHLRPYVKYHPRMNGGRKCKYCESPNVQRHGRVPSNLQTPQYRFTCTVCGGNEVRSLSKEEKDWYGTE